MYGWCIWGLYGVSGPLNSKSHEGLVAFGHTVDSSADTTMATHRIHPNTPSYISGYIEDTCPDAPWIRTKHAPQINHSYDIICHFGGSSDILRHTTFGYGIWACHIGHVCVSVGVSGCNWGVAGM